MPALPFMTGRGPNGDCRATPRSRPVLLPRRPRDRARRRHHLPGNARAARRTTGAGAARKARADAGRELHGPFLPLSLQRRRRALAVVRAAADRRRGAGDADPQADGRNLCPVRARSPRRLFRARYGGAARHEAVLFRARLRFYRAPARPLFAASGNRPGGVPAARPLLAAHLHVRSPKGAEGLPAGRLRRLCPPPGAVRGPARARDPAADPQSPPASTVGLDFEWTTARSIIERGS